MLLRKIFRRDAGFGLVETSIALVTFGIFMSLMLPIVIYATATNQKSQIRLGALIVAQKAFDNLRATPISSMPDDGSFVTIPAVSSNPTPTEIITTQALGRQYTVKITYCPNLASFPEICSLTLRTYLVEIFFKNPNSPVYFLEGTNTILK